MRQLKFVSAALMAFILVGCGGGADDVSAKPKFTSQVSFGDSLSDVGTYKVGFVAAAGGGQFTINGTAPTNWTEFVSEKLGLPAPCAAVTGLIDTSGGDALSVAVTPHSGCTSYAQGGALVTNPYGIHNTYYGTYAAVSGLGGAELTYPVVTQINNYLAANGNSFSGTELVSVVVGGNEVKLQLTLLVGGATAAATAAVTAAIPAQIPLEIAAGNCTAPQAATVCVTAAIATLTPTVGVTASNAYLSPTGPAVTAAVTAMVTAATELVNDVNTLILAKGAKYVVVASIPDFANIPALAAYSAAQKSLVDALVTTFNATLKTGLDGLSGSANILYVDTYTSIKDEITNPAKYNLTNATTQACDPVLTPQNRALLCKASTLITGQTADTHYLFADDTHPTPYGHSLFALYVLQAMTNKGWF